MRNHVEHRRETQNQLVDTVRRYGTVVVAAFVLLPVPLVLIALVGIAFAYACLRLVRPRGKAKATA